MSPWVKDRRGQVPSLLKQVHRLHDVTLGNPCTVTGAESNAFPVFPEVPGEREELKEP